MQREYYAMLFLIVYVGAIVVLFLFIIRRLELKRINIAMNFRDLFIFRNIIVAFLLLEVLFIVSQTFFDLGFFFYEYFNNNFFEIFIESNFYID
jgi:NADH:ubiquinone oxidoreductase subunit 6 (subunit J)